MHVLKSGVPCDIRTSVHGAWLDDDALERLAEDIARLGVQNHRLQCPSATPAALRRRRLRRAPR